MAINRIVNNSVVYPIGVYYKYNLYLIEEYEILKNILINKEPIVPIHIREKTIEIINQKILKLKELLVVNTSNDADKIFNVLEWEEKLNGHYLEIENAYKHKFLLNNARIIKTIELFLRKEKLKEINEKNM